MIQSMTAFATQQMQGEWGLAVCELRSLNHRYLEVGIRVPELMRDIESKIREGLRQKIERGKIECTLRFQPGMSSDPQVVVNAGLVNGLVQGAQKIALMANLPSQLSVHDLLRWPGVLELTTVSSSQAKEAVMAVFVATLEELIVTRQREGEALLQFLMLRLQTMEQELLKIKTYVQSSVQLYRDKLMQRVRTLQVECDALRLEQEISLLVQKSDITEEIDRLTMHKVEVEKILRQGGVVGKRLDFLMQELNREANTLASKAVDDRISKAAVELKIVIEQMREQIQNIE